MKNVIFAWKIVFKIRTIFKLITTDNNYFRKELFKIWLKQWKMALKLTHIEFILYSLGKKNPKQAK